jgi:hypothetical protein
MFESKDDLNLMNLRLMIIKRRTGCHQNTVKNTLNFVVVNGNPTKTYPSNFICRFPGYENGYLDNNSVFSKLFENNEKEAAKKLLKEALAREQDSKIRLAIEKKLRKLN